MSTTSQMITSNAKDILPDDSAKCKDRNQVKMLGTITKSNKMTSILSSSQRKT
jgi:hypothetical protein